MPECMIISYHSSSSSWTALAANNFSANSLSTVLIYITKAYVKVKLMHWRLNIEYFRYLIYFSPWGVYWEIVCHSCEGRNPENSLAAGLDARIRGHDEKNTPTLHLFKTIKDNGFRCRYGRPKKITHYLSLQVSASVRVRLWPIFPIKYQPGMPPAWQPRPYSLSSPLYSP